MRFRNLGKELAILLCVIPIINVSDLRAQGVLTWHNDLARTGQYLNETLLSPANVSSTNFGLLAKLPLDGPVDAQPLYVASLSISGNTHNVLYVGTENGTLYAFDADSGGAPLWQLSLLNAGETPADLVDGCTQVTPTIGITSTPAIDLNHGAHGTIFVVAMSKDGSGNYHQRLHALDLVNHTEPSGWPIEIAATYPGNGPNSSGGILTFDPKQYKDRAALLVSNGIVYTSWASHCDADPYNGWIIGYNETTRAQTVLNLTPGGSRGAIWQAGAGPAADAGGNLYVLMANGTFDTSLDANNFPSRGDYGNAFVNLSTISGISVADYFTMHNTTSESNGDEDLGSGGALLLPTLTDAQGNPRGLAVGAGKDGTAYVVNRNNMGKYNGSTNAVYQQFGLGGSVFSSPAWFNNTLYYGPVGQQIKAFPYAGGAFGQSAFQTSISGGFGYPGTTPSISANGSANGIVWAVQNGSPGVLYAFDASNLNELYDSTQAANSRDNLGASVTFPTPTIANGKVYVGTATGVAIYGLLNCTYSVSSFTPISPTNVNLSIAASAPSCPWSATTTAGDFISINGTASFTGSATISLQFAPFEGLTRTGVIIAAGITLNVTQNGTTTGGLGFYPITPCRVVDTRTGSGFSGAFGAPSFAGGGTRNFPIPASFCNAPASAQAYSMNMTVVVPPSQGLGYLTSWDAGDAIPVVATLNALNGGVVGNAALVPGGTDQAISVFASNPTDLVIDMNGYFAPPISPQALAFYPVTPCRVADTRTGSGFSGPFGQPSLTAGTSRDFPVQDSSCGIPSSALAYSMRLTVVAPGPLGYLTAYPAGQALPVAATLNALGGGVVGNEAIVPAGAAAAGPISVYATNNTDLVIDINGYFAPPGSPGALFFYPMKPCRIADTRPGSGFSGPFGSPSMVGGATRDFPVLSSACGIPSSAQAYSLNMTAVVPSGQGLGYLTAFPAGQTVPVAATLNALNGGVVGSAAIVPANTSTGAISVLASNPTDLVIDINGYFAP